MSRATCMFSMRLCGRRCFLRVIQQKFSHLSALGDADVVYTRWRAGPARGARIDSRTGTGGGEHVLKSTSTSRAVHVSTHGDIGNTGK